jgi:hypothetical protein
MLFWKKSGSRPIKHNLLGDVSLLSGMANESITTTGETTRSAWPTDIADYVRGRAFFPSLALFTRVR